MAAPGTSNIERFPMSGRRVVSTADVDEAAAVVSKHQAPVRITRVSEPARFRLDMTGRQMGRLFVGYNEFATDTIIDGGRVENEVLLSFGNSETNTAWLDLDGEPVPASSANAAVVSPARYGCVHRPAGSPLYVLGMTSSSLTDRYEALTGCAPHMGPSPSTASTRISMNKSALSMLSA